MGQGEYERVTPSRWTARWVETATPIPDSRTRTYAGRSTKSGCPPRLVRRLLICVGRSCEHRGLRARYSPPLPKLVMPLAAAEEAIERSEDCSRYPPADTPTEKPVGSKIRKALLFGGALS